MSRSIVLTNVAVLSLTSIACEFVADFKKSESDAAGTDSGGEGSRGGAAGTANAGGGGSASSGGAVTSTNGGTAGIGVATTAIGGTAGSTPQNAMPPGGTSPGGATLGGTSSSTGVGGMASTNVGAGRPPASMELRLPADRHRRAGPPTVVAHRLKVALRRAELRRVERERAGHPILARLALA